jgi:hypothetical protein
VCKDLVERHFIGAKLSEQMILARSHFENLSEGFFKATGKIAVSLSRVGLNTRRGALPTR